MPVIWPKGPGIETKENQARTSVSFCCFTCAGEVTHGLGSRV